MVGVPVLIVGPQHFVLQTGFPRGSLAGAQEMLPVRGQIGWAFLETCDTASGEFERTSTPPLLLGHELQAPSNDLEFGLPGLFLQPFEDGPVLFAKPRVNVRFHVEVRIHRSWSG
jgi:hypothetical protein